MLQNLPRTIKIGEYNTGHVQGIAVDRERKYIYLSFTTCLVKAELSGKVVGIVSGLAGHLGCIAYNYEDGKVYGSLEYKNDQIGKGILSRLGRQDEIRDGFYIAVFDVEKIDRLDMDAEKDGVMTAVYLDEVYKDYTAEGHRFGCSGIDGTTFAPEFGKADGKQYLYVAYGIYEDNEREDNDNQVILKYDISGWDEFARPLNQQNMHRSGPEKPDGKYFLFTGNTRYGIQNLEYDPVSRLMLAAVYVGHKEKYPNYPMFFIDCTKPAEGDKIFLAEIGMKDEKTGICGSDFPYGSTGIATLQDGTLLISHEYKNENGWGCEVHKYMLENGVFTEV